MTFRILISICVMSFSAGAAGHWAYQAPAATEIPDRTHPVDTLLARTWSEAGLQPAAVASADRWLERAAYTLTGLPPSADQRRRIAASPDQATWNALIDELLADPAYGERWARHWMDVARYADTQGYNFDKDNRYPYAYTYRDWLIRAFNEDRPYDEFVKMQIAADLIVGPEHPDLAALGMLTVGRRQGHVETIDDRVDVITRGFLSTTVSCARCHAHKTDPITMRDYYSIFSILENTIEHQPIIGAARDAKAFAEFQQKKQDLERRDRAVRQGIVDDMRAPGTLTVYLELGWRARKENWNHGRAATEAFKKGPYRAKAVLRWRDFLDQTTDSARLERWASEMESAKDPAKLCRSLADEWIQALSSGGELADMAERPACPLSYDAERIRQIYNQADGNQQRQRDSAMAKLETEHPGAPPRAMAVRDRGQWLPAQVYRRGNPSDRESAFERQWLSVLGGGPYSGGTNARLVMAEHFADAANPLTARVMVNRVWAWHFGAPLADPGDFGPQHPEPALRPLLDHLAVWFVEHGWSVKELHRLLLSSAAFRLAADGPAANDAIDEANTLYWKWHRRRMDFESMRDRILSTAGTLDRGQVGGRSVNLLSSAADHRRSVYGFVDRYALPGLLVNFDVPHPDHHAPKRLATTVPQQALYFLNNDLPIRMAKRLVNDPEFSRQTDDESKLRWLYQRVYHRAPTREEASDAVQWIRAANSGDYSPALGGHWEVRYRLDGSTDAPLQTFPMFRDEVWKTGPDPRTAPVKWLHAGAHGGHVGAGHALVMRWRSHAAGEARIVGKLKRTQQGGPALAWHIAGPDGQPMQQGELPPGGEARIEAPWTSGQGIGPGIKPGNTMDLVLRAPNGDSFGGFSWDLRILGRESLDDPVREISNLRDDFPQTNKAPSLPPTGNPWADLAQALLASNEFHFID